MESAQMVIGKKQITELSEILHSPRSDVVEMVYVGGCEEPAHENRIRKVC
jgi:diphthamide synthase (EF-2-diphthine--ammonia ligase)